MSGFAETWRDRCAHSPECASESDCLSTDEATPRAPSDNSAAGATMKTDTKKKLKTPIHDNTKPLTAEGVKDFQDAIAQRDRTIETLSAILEDRDTSERGMMSALIKTMSGKLPDAVEANVRALDSETFEHLAGTLVLLDKLGASPAVDVIRNATLAELTAHAKRVTAKRVAPAPEVAPS